MSRLIAPLFLVPPPHDCPMFISPPRLPPFFPPLFCSRFTKRHDPHPRGDTVVMNAPRHIHHIISAHHHPLSRSSIAQLFPAVSHSTLVCYFLTWLENGSLRTVRCVQYRHRAWVALSPNRGVRQGLAGVAELWLVRPDVAMELLRGRILGAFWNSTAGT